MSDQDLDLEKVSFI